MILHVLAFKNNKIKAFAQPFYDDRPLENIAVGIGRAIAGSDDCMKWKNKVLFKIGTFDDSKGLLVPCDPEIVLDCDELIASMPSQVEVKENGKEVN